MDWIIIGFEVVVGMVLGVLFLKGCAIVLFCLGVFVSDLISNLSRKKNEKVRVKSKRKKSIN